MEYIDRIFYRKINPSDFKKLYDIDKPLSGGGQTYLEAAGINNDSLTEFLRYAEISDSPLDGETRSIFTFNAHVLGKSTEFGFIEFAPRKNRLNYRISRQNMKYKHPAWSTTNGFPEPLKNENGEYISSEKFTGIIDNLIITIIRTTYKKYYAGFINTENIPENWPKGIDLENIFQGDRRGVLSFTKRVEFRDSLDNPFGKISDTPIENSISNDLIYNSHIENSAPLLPPKRIKYHSGINIPKLRNRIIFGAPGTGKSYSLNNELKELLGDINESNYERVTFHPDYSYANFVGTYKPVMVGHDSKKIDAETKSILDILKDKNKSAQDKYNELYDKFKNDSVTRLPILIGICSDGQFQTKKKDGSDAANNNGVERNHGVAIRQFVKLIDDTTNNSSGDIAYEYVPGPFMRMYVKALKNAQTDNPQPFLLIIEEINRANVAAVFGDVFQLLDRDEDNISEYPIQASEDIKKYLAKEFDQAPEDFAQIRIPDNLFIWATMNSADQGVFPMDTAFKRRWDFTYLGIDEKANEIAQQCVFLNNGTKVYWNGLRMAINDYLAKIGINEDKQLGPFFLKKDVISDSKKFCGVFKHKIIMYLFEDAAKQKRASVFSSDIFKKEDLRYSKICEAFDERGIEIFNKEIQDKCAKYDPAEYTSTNDEES